MKLIIPQSYEHITIGQFQQLTIVLNEQTEDSLTPQIKILSILCNESEDAIAQIALQDIIIASSKLDWMHTLPEAKEYPIEIRINGKLYKVKTLASRMTASDHINIDTFVKQRGGIIPSLHEILAVMCYNKKKESFEELMARAKLFQDNMSVMVAYPLAVFFLTMLKHSLLLTQTSAEKMITKQTQELRMILQEHQTSPSAVNGN